MHSVEEEQVEACECKERNQLDCESTQKDIGTGHGSFGVVCSNGDGPSSGLGKGSVPVIDHGFGTHLD